MTDNDKALDKIIRASMPLDFERKETLSDDKALVERLRSIYRVKLPNYIDDAADRIEAQAAEIDRLLDYDEAKANALHNTLNQLANAEQEIERLREAGDKLNFFAGHAEYCCNGLWTDPVACDCGYTNAWKAWRVALGEGND